MNSAIVMCAVFVAIFGSSSALICYSCSSAVQTLVDETTRIACADGTFNGTRLQQKNMKVTCPQDCYKVRDQSGTVTRGCTSQCMHSEYTSCCTDKDYCNAGYRAAVISVPSTLVILSVAYFLRQ